MNFRTRIWMLPLTAAATFIAGTVASFVVATHTSTALERLQKSEYPLKEHVDRFDQHMKAFRAVVQAAAAEGDATRLDEAKSLAGKARAQLDAIAALPGRADEAKPLREAMDAYEPATMQAALAMTGKGDAGDSMQRMADGVKVLDQRISDAVGRASEGVAAAQSAAAKGVDRSLVVLGITGLVTLLSLGLASTLVVRSVWRDLGEEPAILRTLVQRIADGDLAAVSAQPGDSLRASLGRMAERLRETVSGIRVGADAISNASNEITSGSHDLSSRTERTSARLQQTASAMEQMTSNVRQTASSAVLASDLARQASDSATRGGSIVGDVVDNMQQITDASTKIGDIIGVINGIAFQTNILALNAAVEAARAGEQGRGFAVVAAEVRTLAQRSAQAAREIKELITVSTERVEDGARRVRDAGGAMQEIVANVRRVADIIGEIEVAANEQSDGITDVNASISELDGMTQQNAALVEESAAAASSLRHQALTLAEAVRTFRVSAEPA